MHSISKFHYPHILNSGEGKLLWNPVLKKSFKNRPEERVRLKVIEYFLHEAGWMRHRIAQEVALPAIAGEHNVRSDIVFYSRDFKPVLLVECKAEHIALSGSTAVQIASYNKEVGARFLLLTNGIQDIWCEIENGKPSILEEIPEIFLRKSEPIRDFEYWNKRGFAGSKTPISFRKWILQSCEELFAAGENEELIRYLSFPKSKNNDWLEGHYKLHTSGGDILLIGCTGTRFGSTHLNALIYDGKMYTKGLSVSLDLLGNGEKANTVLFEQHASKTLDFSEISSEGIGKSIHDLTYKILSYMRL